MQNDDYITRTEQPETRYQRLDPVVHAGPDSRWNGPLDEVALSAFERDGFLWFEGFFSQDRMAPFFDELEAMSHDEELLGSDGVIRDPKSGEVRSVFDMHRISPRFDELTRDARILGMVQQLLGGDVYIHQSRINDKYGFQGAGFDWHSDFETWHAEDGMPRMRAISASIMLTDNNEFNGPLMLIPGSHHQFVPVPGGDARRQLEELAQGPGGRRAQPAEPSGTGQQRRHRRAEGAGRVAAAVRVQRASCIELEHVALAAFEPVLRVQQHLQRAGGTVRRRQTAALVPGQP